MDGNTDTIVIYDENTSKHKEREDTDKNQGTVITFRLSINLKKRLNTITKYRLLCLFVTLNVVVLETRCTHINIFLFDVNDEHSEETIDVRNYTRQRIGNYSNNDNALCTCMYG